MAVLNYLQHLVSRRSVFLFQALNLNPVVRVFHDLKFLFVIQEVDDLASVDLVEAQGETYVLFNFLRNFKHVRDSLLSISIHGESFT